MTRMRIPYPPVKPPATSREQTGPRRPTWDHASDHPAQDAQDAENTQRPSPPPQRLPSPRDLLWFTKFRKRWDDPVPADLADATDAAPAVESAAHDAAPASAATLRQDAEPERTSWDHPPDRSAEAAEDTQRPSPPPQRPPIPRDLLWFTRFRKRWDDPMPADLADAPDVGPAVESAAHDAALPSAQPHAAAPSAATLHQNAEPGWTSWDHPPVRSPGAAEDTQRTSILPQRQPVPCGDRLWFTKFRKRWDDPMPAEPSSADEPTAAARSSAAVQLRAAPGGAAELTASEVHAAAAAGIRRGGEPLPHGDRIQRAFGPDHDLSQVTAHVGGPATAAAAQLRANAYTVGEHIAFASAPDLRLAAHEAAHVMQQRSGVALSGGVGRCGDPYEQNADAIAERVVHARSATDLLPPTAMTPSHSPAVQREAASVDPIQTREDTWATEMEARRDGAEPGDARARALRAILLFEQGPVTPFSSVDAVDRFAEHCEHVADNEGNTLEELARYTDSADILIDHGAAFPRTWAQNIAKLGSGVDHTALFRVMETTKVGVLELAHSIHDDVWNRGLPLSTDDAMQLTAGNLLGRTLSLAHARDPSDEITARFARAALRWEVAISHFYLVQLYDGELDHRIQEIRSGELVIDQAELSSLQSKHRAFQAWLARLQKAEVTHNTGETLQALMLRDPTRFHRVTGVSDYQFSWSTETVGAFRAEIDQVDRQIAASNQLATIWRAARWASERGYNGAAAREVWDAMKDNAVTSIATLLSIVLLQAIPGVNVAVDLVLMMEFGGDIIDTAAELGETLRAAGAARTTVELQQASIRMARSLVGSAAELALFAVTWGAGKAAGKIARWRRGEQFVARNSTTPETTAQARRALADAKGDVDAAEKLLRRRQEHARQQQELARTEQERLNAERQAREAEAGRKAEGEPLTGESTSNKAPTDKPVIEPAEGREPSESAREQPGGDAGQRQVGPDREPRSKRDDALETQRSVLKGRKPLRNADGSDYHGPTAPVDELWVTQDWVSEAISEGLPVEQLGEIMAETGWRGAPLDVVKMPPDGHLLSIDNRRIVAARRANEIQKAKGGEPALPELPVQIHASREPFPPSDMPERRVRSFTLRNDIRRADNGRLYVGGGTDPIVFARGTKPTSWEEAGLFRTANQGKSLDLSRYPETGGTFPVGGTKNTPILKGKQGSKAP